MSKMNMIHNMGPIMNQVAVHKFLDDIKNNSSQVHMKFGYLCYEGQMFVTEIWYRIHPLTGFWQWTPDLQNWMDCKKSNNVVIGGIWHGKPPAHCNIYIIEYLAQNGATLPNNENWKKLTPQQQQEYKLD